MAQDHIVKPGEHLFEIAARHGFGDPATIWDHPNNQALKSKRKRGEILAPGDVLHIPDKTPKEVSVATGRTYTFVVKRPKLEFRLRLRDLAQRARGAADCTLDVAGRSEKKTADGQGVVVLPIAPDDHDLSVTVGGQTLQLRIGELDPIDDEQGWQARLVNLGYLEDLSPSDSDDHDEQTVRSAIEEFECDHDLPLTGEMNDTTKAKLLAVHGC